MDLQPVCPLEPVAIHVPRDLRDLPDGRGRSPATDVRRNPVLDRPVAGTTRAGMRGPGRSNARATGGEACLDTGKTVRISVAVPSTAGFDRLLPATKAICRCPSRSKGRSWPQNRRESGECRFSAFLCGDVGFWRATNSRVGGRGRYILIILAIVIFSCGARNSLDAADLLAAEAQQHSRR